MLSIVFFGVFLGWGAAIPVGPVNLEIARRNLNHGSTAGIIFGLGACLADLTYLIVLSLGIFTLLNDPKVLSTVGFLGSLLLFWFAYKAFSLKTDFPNPPRKGNTNLIDGYLMTLVNPYTILFWASITSQLPVLNTDHEVNLIKAGVGLLLGVFSWVLMFNWLLYHSKKRFSLQFNHRLNQLGGAILIVFATAGILKSIF
jgi:L-lysine exporter family protein LysE/ArgO